MLSRADNQLLTRTGPGTGAGAVLRQYWTPAALTQEINDGNGIVPVELLGEQLLLFRSRGENNGGDLGLIDRHCPHRGVDLCHARLEADGLRCPFHGWKFATDGRCLEQPGEPEGSRAHQKIRTTSYPVVEKNGIVFAYLGEGDPPPLPGFDCFRAPGSHVFAFKGLWNCNWLQALEVGIDPVHASFLHRFLADDDPSEQYGKQFRDTAAGTTIPITKLLRDYPRPEIGVEETGFGLRITALRHMANGQTHVRITNQIFPIAVTIPMSSEMNITQWHVPVDDHRCYWYALFTSFTAPVDGAVMRAQRLAEHSLPLYAPKRNAGNDYGFDQAEQDTLTYTGMGPDINVHDQWACESPGTIRDRTKEHLGSTDKAITAHRRMLMGAIKKLQNDENLPGGAAGLSGPIAVDAIGATDQQDEIWRGVDAARRAACPWDAGL
ncbi:MAG: aromatic ring-hydroxylating dioxygenase subunit alpha [Alphaproteobacteria bacterium]|jgi:phenylpropionate dioxygenase-like ring-hydroxylating dioxygenase large terminal subunit